MDMNQGESEHDYECLLEADEGASANASSVYVFLAGRDASSYRCLSDASLTDLPVLLLILLPWTNFS